MIQTSSVVLVADANMLLTIAKDSGSASLVAALCSWISSVIERTEPRPRGKTVTVLATNAILHDYWTGLNRGGYRVNQGTKREFQAYTGKITVVDRERDVRFSVRVVKEPKGAPTVDVGDRYDRPYPSLLMAIPAERRLSDRHVIFGSRDAKLLDGARDAVMRTASADRFSFAAGLTEFEEAIMC